MPLAARTADGRLLCARCADVIGIFEPVIRHHDGSTHETSLAADPDLEVAPGALYHYDCFSMSAP
jgi:hypothetical protein